MRASGRSRLFWALLAVAAVIWPEPAYAWGPATHLDFGLQMLRGAFAIAPVVRLLIEKYPIDYLYGCVAADIIVGKNRAVYEQHAHNWKNGWQLLHEADAEPQRALAYGFLAHLASDIVAHNYFVPFKMVQSFEVGATQHTYWELRFEHLAHERERVWETWREVRGSRFPTHDGFLRDHLPKGASRLLPFGASRRVFQSAMRVMSHDRWRAAVRKMASRSRLPLDAGEVDEFRSLAVNATAALLKDGERSLSVTADPVGRSSLLKAREIRLKLRSLKQQRHFNVDGWDEALALMRAGFRGSIYGPLVLPNIEELLSKPPTKGRRLKAPWVSLGLRRKNAE